MKFLELRVPPVVQFVVVGLAMWGLAEALPAFQISIPGAAWIAKGLCGVGLIVGLLAVVEFGKAGTTTDPRYPHKATSLVVGGIYRFSRNPIYLGLLLILTGGAFSLANGLSFLLLPVFVGYMNRFQIAPEERHMQEKFGDEFLAYKARVRRWI